MAATKSGATADMADKPAPEVEQAIAKAAEEGKTASDARKEANVAAGGYVGTSLPPDPSGATMEDELRQAQPMDHPAIDSQPRYGVPPDAVRQDFNDPTK